MKRAAAVIRIPTVQPARRAGGGSRLPIRGLLMGLQIALLAAPVAALEPAAPTELGLAAERLQRVGELAQEYVAAERLPGVVWGVARDGRLAVLEAVGPVETHTIHRIYSMTKPVTTVAVLMLFEEGRFLLTDPVARYLPEFAAPRVWVAPGESRPATGPLTIRQLLTHTAGLSYDEDVAGVPRLYQEAQIWEVDSLAEFTARVAGLPLAFEPGTRWHYSVANDVLGRLVEVVAGQPFDEFLAERIFAPLGMDDTGFRLPPSSRDRLAPLYTREGEGMRPAADDRDALEDPALVPYGGHGLLSTAGDYLRFAQLLLNGGELDGQRLLSRKTVELMFTDHLPAEWKPPMPEAWLAATENRTGDLDLGLGYGLGGYVVTDVARNGVPGSVGTYAWGGGASTYFFIDPREGLAAIFLTQLRPSDSYPLRAEFRAAVYQALAD